MRKQSAAKNILMKDGKARRVPSNRAEELIASGQAKHYISNTVYKAMKLGIEVEDPKTRDTDGALRAKIRDAREGAETRNKKKEKERKKAEQEFADLADEVSAHYRDD